MNENICTPGNEFSSECKRIDGYMEFGSCKKRVEFINKLNQKIQRIVEVSPVKSGGFVVTEGSQWDSGFDTNIFIETMGNSFKLAGMIIKAEGNPEKMFEIVSEKVGDLDGNILDPSDAIDRKILEEL